MATTISEELQRHFAFQADACEMLGSPLTARLCRLLPRLLDGTTLTGRRVIDWSGKPGADAVALRLCGGLHALVLSGRDAGLRAVYPPAAADDDALEHAVAAAIGRHDGFLVRWLDSPPQTNEIARSAMLLPGLILIARETGRPLALREIGASAGLNLNLDRFQYRYGGEEWGDPSSSVRLAPEVKGAAPPLGGPLDIVSRAGCDVMPVDVAEEAERQRLKAYVWADQRYRLERLDAAMELARRHPYKLVGQDAASFVAEEMARRPRDAVFVLFHSIMWQYMPGATKAAIRAALEKEGAVATADAPLAHLSMEPVPGETGHAVLSLTMWPGGQTRRLANCDFHGRWIEWLGLSLYHMLSA